MDRVLLSLGSNKSYQMPCELSHRGNEEAIDTQGTLLSPRQILFSAVEEMGCYLSGIKCSSVYCTSPMYVTDQDDFLNMAVLAVTALDPHSLLRAIHRTEAHLGRDRSRETRNGPRTLDIDIVCFDGKCVHDDDPSMPIEDRLIVPHPKMAERAFVLIPAVELLEVCNEWDSAVCATMKKALQGCKGQRVVPECGGAVYRGNRGAEKV